MQTTTPDRSFRIKGGDPQDTFTIRPATSKDHQAIYSLIRTAFETAKVSDGDEQDFAVGLRESGAYIPELDLIAEYRGRLVGHIMLTSSAIRRTDGRRIPALLVAPLSVELRLRNAGVGSALMKEGLHRARQMGYTLALLCGDPGYYKRFCFAESASFSIRPTGDIPQQYMLACELEEGALRDAAGIFEGC